MNRLRQLKANQLIKMIVLLFYGVALKLAPVASFKAHTLKLAPVAGFRVCISEKHESFKRCVITDLAKPVL
jgi:hypothetical protein